MGSAEGGAHKLYAPHGPGFANPEMVLEEGTRTDHSSRIAMPFRGSGWFLGLSGPGNLLVVV